MNVVQVIVEFEVLISRGFIHFFYSLLLKKSIKFDDIKRNRNESKYKACSSKTVYKICDKNYLFLCYQQRSVEIIRIEIQ